MDSTNSHGVSIHRRNRCCRCCRKVMWHYRIMSLNPAECAAAGPCYLLMALWAGRWPVHSCAPSGCSGIHSSRTRTAKTRGRRRTLALRSSPWGLGDWLWCPGFWVLAMSFLKDMECCRMRWTAEGARRTGVGQESGCIDSKHSDSVSETCRTCKRTFSPFNTDTCCLRSL